MIVLLCNECATKVRLNFTSHELMPANSDRSRMCCGHCRKQRYCVEYDMKQKENQASEV